VAGPTKTLHTARFAFWAAMICSWLVQALAARHTLDADGVSYLNIANAGLQGNWHAFVNGYWSPGYPFLLTVWFKLLRPSPFHEPLAVRMLAVVTLVVALLSFEYFLKVFLEFRRKDFGSREEENSELLSDGTVRVAGYVLFFWITVFWTTARLDQPDILVFIVYLLASALGMRIVLAPRAWSLYAVFGAVLGLAYLVKAVMFPLAFVFFVALLLHKEVRKAFWKVALAFVVFIVVALPFVSALSRAKGRLTYGDSGAVNYLQMIGTEDNRMPWYSHATGMPPAVPPLLAAPHIDAYIPFLNLGTFPPWADPSYGFKGASHHFYLAQQLNRIHVDLRVYFELFAVRLGALVCGILILFFCSGNIVRGAALFFRQPMLWIPAIAGLGLYALVRVEARFLAGFTLALFAACAGAVHLPAAVFRAKLERSVAWAFALLLLAQVLVEVGHDGVKLLHRDPYPDWQVVTTLRTLGVQPGDRVSYMGDTLSDHVWAYLGRLSLVSDIPPEDVNTFWAASSEEKQRAVSWLAASGSKILVTRNVPDSAVSFGWKQVAGTDYFVLPLSDEVKHSAANSNQN
jgi:hypothetical protein